MTKRKTIPQEIKSQILSRVKNDGISSPQAAREAGISDKTVYNWLSKEAEPGKVSIHKYNALKRELQATYELIGRLTTDLNKTKKKGGN